MVYDKKIVVIGTGGTIAGQSGSAEDLTGYQAGELSIEQVLATVPGVEGYGPFESHQLCNIDSSDMTMTIWAKLAHTVQVYVDREDVAAVVITHGTDTLEEGSYFLHLTVRTTKPIVMVGAMRPATAISADGPLNLLQAVQIARSPQAVGQGVLVTLNGTINCARDVVKQHTTDVAAFGNSFFGHLGFVQDGQAHFYYQTLRKHTANSEFAPLSTERLPKVALITLYGGVEAELIHQVLQGKPHGIVLAGLGHGILPEKIRQIVEHSDIPIVRSSRTGSGMVSAMPSDSRFGFIVSDTLAPSKARLLLMLGLTKTTDRKQLQTYFEQY
ncbi:asparaginase [Veillonella sp.]|uniref:asparaginase n=1 Tax=Veillonella sp. TaxID=1926307 RepID=UPI0025FACAA8|nr:asparaginase [Veillonella sp.]